MLKRTIVAVVATALVGSVGVTFAAKGGNAGGNSEHDGGMSHSTSVNSNAPGTIDRDLGRARATARAHISTSATAKVKPNRVATATTTKITPKKVTNRATTNTRYHSKVKRHPIPRVEHAPDFRALSREQRMADARANWQRTRRL